MVQFFIPLLVSWESSVTKGFHHDLFSDVNECETNCTVSPLTCTNLPGSYSCACQTGYTFNAGGDTVTCIGEYQPIYTEVSLQRMYVSLL